MAPLGLEVAYRVGKVAVLAAWKLPLTIVGGILTSIPGLLGVLSLRSYDTALFLINILTPRLKKGTVVAPGRPGYNGLWPKFVPPTESDSRSPCPYLNALSNHGILPHDGRNITMDQLNDVMNGCFNFSKTLCKNTTDTVAGLYHRNHIDLSDLSYHNVIEHDASLIRHDHSFEPDQTVISKDLVNQMLASATGKPSPEHPEGYLTPGDLSRFLVRREKDSLARNPLFSLSVPHRFFGASNASLMLEVAAGDVRQLRTILTEERIPNGWETSLRQRFGYTMIEFHSRSLEIFLGRSDVPGGAK